MHVTSDTYKTIALLKLYAGIRFLYSPPYVTVLNHPPFCIFIIAGGTSLGVTVCGDLLSRAYSQPLAQVDQLTMLQFIFGNLMANAHSSSTPGSVCSPLCNYCILITSGGVSILRVNCIAVAQFLEFIIHSSSIQLFFISPLINGWAFRSAFPSVSLWRSCAYIYTSHREAIYHGGAVSSNIGIQKRQRRCPSSESNLLGTPGTRSNALLLIFHSYLIGQYSHWSRRLR